MLRIMLFCLVLAGCGGLDFLKHESSRGESVPDGGPTTGCLQGAVIDGITGEQIDISAFVDDDGIFVRVRNEFKRGAAVGKDKEPIRGEYRLCGVPLDETFPVVVRAAGYQDFYSETDVASTRAAIHGSARHDIRSTRPVTIANIRLFPSGALAKDYVVAVHHNGNAVEGASVYLKANGGQIFTNTGGFSFLNPIGHEFAAPSGVTDSAGLFTIAAADLVWGARYSVLAMQPATGRLKTSPTIIFPGLRTSTGADPYRVHIELPFSDLELAVVSRSLDAENPSATGAISYVFNRAIEQIPGTKDNVTAVLSDDVVAVLAADVPGNDASEQVDVKIEGNQLTLTPKFLTKSDASKEPGLEISYNGIQVRPVEGEKRTQSITLADTVSFYGGVPIHNKPLTFAIVSGDGQVGQASMTLNDALVVNVKDLVGANLAGTTVTWQVESGNGIVSSATTLSDATGNAQVDWDLGFTGVDQRVSATVDGVAALTFSANIRSIIVSSGNNQSAVVSTLLVNPLVAELQDSNGDPVANENVIFTVGDVVNGGSLDNGADAPATTVTAQTDVNGLASVEWAMGAVGGAYSVTATPGGNVVPATFTATAVEQLVIASEDADADITNGDPVNFTVALRDQNGDPMVGVVLRLVASDAGSGIVANGGVSGADVTATTDGSGQVVVVWTTGPTVGSQTVTITVPSDAAVVPLVFARDVI